MEGLDIELKEFQKMKSLERDITIYKNLKHIRHNLRDYNFHKKIQYVWLFLLTAFVGVKKFIGI